MAKAKTTPEETVEEVQEVAKPVSNYIICDEWKGEFVGNEFEPLKIVRKNVKLTPEAFEVLNASCAPLNPIKYIEQK